jgi:hypothetical protein
MLKVENLSTKWRIKLIRSKKIEEGFSLLSNIVTHPGYWIIVYKPLIPHG